MGEIEIWECKRKGTELVAVKHWYVTNKEEMEELKTQLEDMTRLNHPNLIAVMAVKALNQQGYLCGENNKLTAYYQHFA